MLWNDLFIFIRLYLKSTRLFHSPPPRVSFLYFNSLLREAQDLMAFSRLKCLKSYFRRVEPFIRLALGQYPLGRGRGLLLPQSWSTPPPLRILSSSTGHLLAPSSTTFPSPTSDVGCAFSISSLEVQFLLVLGCDYMEGSLWLSGHSLKGWPSPLWCLDL